MIKKLMPPPGSTKATNQKRPHFDTVNKLYAEEHHGKYLIVRNSKSDSCSYSHNRLYLCKQSAMEFIVSSMNADQSCRITGIEAALETKGLAKSDLLSLYPEHGAYVRDFLFQLVDRILPRSSGNQVVIGFGIMIDILLSADIDLPSVTEFKNKHLNIVSKEMLDERFNNQAKVYVNRFLTELKRKNDAFVLKHIQVNQAQKPPTMLSSDVVFQLDHYAQKELKENVCKAKEYAGWMEELESIELFSLENLAYTYYDNIDRLGRMAAALNRPIRNIAKELFNVELQCWKRRSNGIPQYFNKEDKHRHQELLELSRSGFNISIADERMGCMWNKTFFPDWPLNDEPTELFKNMHSTSAISWRSNNSTGLKATISEFKKIALPTMEQLYPLILMLMIRTGLNQEVLRDWRVKKDADGSYKLGDETGLGVLIDGEKGRGNSIQTVVIDLKSKEKKYLDFYLKWMTPLYDYSGSDRFFQYLGSTEIMAWDSSSKLTNLQYYGKNSNTFFYNKYTIIETKTIDGNDSYQRLKWIDHRLIRPAKNYSNYLMGFNEFQRQVGLGHKSLETQNRHYRESAEWKGLDSHRIAMAQRTITRFFMGEITSKDDEKLTIYETPMANCSDPSNPLYPGAPKIKNDEICTNWRMCLTECQQSKVLPKVHGPVIMAWRNCMDTMRSDFYHAKDWDKEFLEDYSAANFVLNMFKHEDKVFCEKEAPSYETYVRQQILSTQKKRRA